jgi:hypothetical protein
VREHDAGHVVFCRVTPKRLDGSPAPSLALSSDFTVPQIPGPFIVPSYLKDAYKAGDVMIVAKDGADVFWACLAGLFVPGIGELECGATLIEAGANIIITSAFDSLVDPPDRNYKSVALPVPDAKPSGRLACGPHVKPHACRSLSVLAARYGGAAAEAGSLVQVLAISRNRTLIARKRKDSETELIQQGARKVYAGLLVDALRRQERVGLVYAEALGRAHADVHVTAETLRRIAKYGNLRRLGRGLVRQLVKSGFTQSAIQQGVRSTIKRVGAFDLQVFLRRPLGTAALTKYYDSMELNDVLELVGGLARQHALERSRVPQLLADLDKARAACTQAGRAGALQQFVADAHSAAHAPYLRFLATAIQPLATGASTADPYPHCLR